MALENAVALKLPDFWNSQQHVRFAQAEAQFLIKNHCGEYEVIPCPGSLGLSHRRALS